MLDNALKKLKIGAASLIYGMKAGEDLINQQVDSSGSMSIVDVQTKGGWLDDMLKQKETQQVKEVRDSYYRILKESSKYKVEVTGFKKIYDESEDGDGDSCDFNGDAIYAVASKKTLADYVQHADVYNPEHSEIKVIQNNKQIRKKSMFSVDEEDLENIHKLEDYNSYVTTIEIERDGFIPRFKLEQIATNIVIKTIDDKRSRVEIYIPEYPPQFAPRLSAILTNVRNSIKNNYKRNELFDFKTIKFTTDTPWTYRGTHSGDVFEYTNPVLKEFANFDGSIVLIYECDIVKEFEYVGDKYHTDEMDEKYENFAPKTNEPNIFAIERLDKYKEQQLKEKNNENSN